MTTILIRFIFITLCSIYIFYRILNFNSISSKVFYLDLICTFIIALLSTAISKTNSPLRLFTLFILFLTYLSLTKKIKPSVTILAGIISFSISYLSLCIVACLIGIIITPINTNSQFTFSPILSFIAGILELFLLFLLFKIPRLKHGMPFINKERFSNWGMIFCTLIISIYFCSQIVYHSHYFIRSLTFLVVFFLAIALLVWWRYKITQSYVEKLRVDEVELLYKEISNKDLEIEKLHANNDHLARIIHKDNKLIPAMELAVRNYLQTASLMKPEDAKQMGSDLLAKLECMSKERKGIIRTYQESNTYRQRSGLLSIDAIIDYMENRSNTFGIQYHYQFDKGIKEMLPAFINEEDAMHLLSDIIDNAIIATTHSTKKQLAIHIGFIRGTLFMDISDSGIPFSPETYQKFGCIKHTTHAEEGGSGIGLMDIAKLKEQYKFSIQIYEYPEADSDYTKKIRILFDKKNHYLIQSYRAKEISSIVLRNDLHVLPSDNEI